MCLRFRREAGAKGLPRPERVAARSDGRGKVPKSLMLSQREDCLLPNVAHKTNVVLRDGKAVERLLLCYFADELQGRTDVIRGEIVLSLDFLEGHSSGQAADHDRNGYPRTSDHRLPVGDLRVDCYTLIRCHDVDIRPSSNSIDAGMRELGVT